LTKFESAAREFLAGATAASPRAFLVSILLGVMILASLEVALSRGLLWRLEPGWLLSTPYDDWTHAMWAVNQLSESSDVIPLYLIGGSGSREAVISNESVEQALAAGSTKKYRFLNLGTRNQTFFEAIILIENLPDTKSGMIIFGLTPHFFTDGISEAQTAVYGTRFPLYSHTLVRALDAMGVLDHAVLPINVMRYRAMFANYLNKRIAEKTFFEKLSYRNHLYEGLPPKRGDELREWFNLIRSDMIKYPHHAILNFEMLEIAIKLAQRKGYEVLLVDLPRNPVGEEPLYGPILDSYNENIGILAESRTVEHIDMHAQYQFPQSYFYDHLHQIDSARVIFQGKFVELILEKMDTKL